MQYFKTIILSTLLLTVFLAGCEMQKPELTQTMPPQVETTVPAPTETSVETTIAQPEQTPPTQTPSTELAIQKTENESYRDILSTLNDVQEFALVDLDGDGTEECFFWDSRQRIGLYTKKGGAVIRVTTTDGDSFHGQVALCEGGIIKTWEEPEADRRIYSFYRVIDTTLVLQNQLDCNEGNGTWTQILNGITMGTMTREEAELMLNAYTEIPLYRQSIDQFPENP